MTAAAKPWLSVIMPVHRGEAWIDATLDSVVAAGADGIELIVIDSTPEAATLARAARYADRLDLRLFDRPDLLMWTAKTNFGAGIARADHLCWLHQDDLWLPGRPAAVRTWIDAAPGAALHLSPTEFIDGGGVARGLWRCPLPAGRSLSGGEVIDHLVVQNFVATPAPVIARAAWIACGGLDEALWYTADWDVWLKLAALGPTIYHDVPTAAFRVHGGSLTVTGSHQLDDFTHQMAIVLDRHLDRVGRGARRIERAARASITVNTALARAAAGDARGLWAALRAILALGPAGIVRYLRDSCLAVRVSARLRAKLAGGF